MMAGVNEPQQVSDSVGKINGEVAVGADFPFQRRWWRFERAVWVFFGLAVIAGLSGALGNSGPLAHGYYRSEDGFFTVEYERVPHYGTPFRVMLHAGPSSIREGRISVWLSRESIRDLGFQRSIPSADAVTVDENGTTLSFPAGGQHGDIELMFKPATAGRQRLEMHTRGSLPFSVVLLVLP